MNAQFHMDPIIAIRSPAGPRLLGNEMLYRGPTANWNDVDQAKLRALAAGPDPEWPLFFNMTTQSILTADEDQIAALAHRRFVMEWTEIPESVSSQDIREAAQRLCQWRSDYRLRLAIDDIGSPGLDGFSRALLVSPDIIKIDGALVHQARIVPEARSLIGHIVGWAREQRILSVIEWVETWEDLEIAKALNAHCVQGYLHPQLLNQGAKPC